MKSHAVLQMRFENRVDNVNTREKIEKSGEKIAPLFVDVPGMLWKIWLIDEVSSGSCGTYLFESREAIDAYIESELFKSASSSIGRPEVRIYDVMEAASLITRAPITM